MSTLTPGKSPSATATETSGPSSPSCCSAGMRKRGSSTSSDGVPRRTPRGPTNRGFYTRFGTATPPIKISTSSAPVTLRRPYAPTYSGKGPNRKRFWIVGVGRIVGRERGNNRCPVPSRLPGSLIPEPVLVLPRIQFPAVICRLVHEARDELAFFEDGSGLSHAALTERFNVCLQRSGSETSSGSSNQQRVRRHSAAIASA